jgi:AraC-like DNA-binding protein
VPHLDLELLDAAFTRYQFRRHTHDAYAIACIIEGRGQMECNGTPHELVPHSVVLINPGEVHDGGPVPGDRLVYRNLYIGPDTLREIGSQVSDALPQELAFTQTLVTSPIDARRIAELSAILQAAASQLGVPRRLAQGAAPRLAELAPPGRLAIDSALVTALGPILCAHARVPPPAPARRPGPGLARVREALHAAPTHDYSLPDLSRIAQLSAFHLVRSFHDAYGLPPAAYQRDLRLRQARRRLHAEVSIATVAAECGFCDQAHLGRWFKRTYGVTPAAYRRAVHRPGRSTAIALRLDATPPTDLRLAAD